MLFLRTSVNTFGDDSLVHSSRKVNYHSHLLCGEMAQYYFHAYLQAGLKWVMTELERFVFLQIFTLIRNTTVEKTWL